MSTGEDTTLAELRGGVFHGAAVYVPLDAARRPPSSIRFGGEVFDLVDPRPVGVQPVYRLRG